MMWGTDVLDRGLDSGSGGSGEGLKVSGVDSKEKKSKRQTFLAVMEILMLDYFTRRVTLPSLPPSG